jgi:septum formation protein
MAAVRLVLASASPRRAELLAAAGFVFDTLPVDVDERVSPGEDPAAYVQRLASEKSLRALSLVQDTGRAGQAGRVGQVGWVGQVVRAGQERLAGQVGKSEEAVVLGADTAVVVDGEIFGKPADAADGERMVRRIAGRRHAVLTGVSLRLEDRELRGVESTLVDVMPLSDADVAWYCGSGEGADKAGAYAIQGLASRFITRIDGSYANVVGPVAMVFDLIRRLASAG